MKKYLLLIICIASTIVSFCQSNSSFKIAFHYVQTQRPILESYLEELSDSMQINSVLDIHQGMGISFGMLFGTNRIEFDAGGGYIRSADEIGSDTANLLYYNNADINFYFGANYLPVNFFLIGGSFVINSANAKCNESGPGFGDAFLEPLPSTDFHVFRGYSVALKAQSGFYINLNKDKGNRMRLTGYYVYGLGDYNFYTVSEKRLKGFTGEQKTNYTTMGIELAFMFGM